MSIKQKYVDLLKHLASEGPVYENWCQYQELARLAVKDKQYEYIQERFYQRANLSEFTAEQLAEGFRLPDQSFPEPYRWVKNSKTFEWEWKYD